MNPDVRVQFGDLIEPFLADVANMVADAAVLLHVLAERRVATECLATLVAFQRLLPCV